MTDADLDKLEALAKAATQGEWVNDAPGCIGIHYLQGGKATICTTPSEYLEDQANAAFIAAANPATILDLIASARRDAEEIERLIGYAVHDDTCTTNRFPGHDVCSCGLSSLLQRIRHEREARAAHTGEG